MDDERDPTPYTPPTDEECCASALETVRRGLARMPDLRFAHTVDVKVRMDGVETWHEGDWFKYLPVAFPELGE